MIIAAISGGVDSVVLLDLLRRKFKPNQVIIAHINHGIRSDAGRDEDLVRSLAKDYKMKFCLEKLQLGEYASEEQARIARYEFLRKLAAKYDAKIVTAHHADDVIESIAINLSRGTGWRGLAVMNADDILRPLTKFYKFEIINYAKKHGLIWHEDSTNQSDIYTRNRLRKKLAKLSLEHKNQLLELWQDQLELAAKINYETSQLYSDSRHFYIMIEPEIGREVLRKFLQNHGISQTRPQLERILLAIKTARPNSQYSINANCKMYFSASKFWLEHQ